MLSNKLNINMKVLVSDNISPKGVKILEKAGLKVDVKTGRTPKELKKDIGKYDGLVIRSATKLTRDVMTGAGNTVDSTLDTSGAIIDGSLKKSGEIIDGTMQFTDEATKKGSTLRSRRRVSTPGASLAWIEESIRCPVKAD